MRELYLASVKALAAGRVTVDALVDAADRAMYRHQQLMRGARAATA